MADVTASAIATALNTAWDDKTYAKPMPGSGFTSTGPIPINRVDRVSSVQVSAYGTTKQVFHIWFRHPTEAAINYTNDLINALTLAGTIIVRPMIIGKTANGEHEANIEFEMIQ